MWLYALLACTGPDESRPVDESAPPIDGTPPDDSGGTDDTGTPGCAETAAGAIDEEAFPWMAFDNDSPNGSMKNYKRSDWTSENGTVFNGWSDPGWEGVRFELAHPARLHALKVNWGELPEAQTPVTIGLYPDFGYNGINFLTDAPSWTGTRCLDASDEGNWVTYRVDPPIEVDVPTLVWAGNYRDGDAGPGISLDSDYAGDGSCALWDDCHSSIIYPKVDDDWYYTGASYPMPYDFMVQLQYEYTEVIAEDDRWFAVDPALSASANVSWGDYDDDGDDDLMTNGPTLYRNDGGSFTNVTSESGVAASGVYTSGGVWGDYDNDGCLDYYGMGGGYSGGELLLKNGCDGTFTDTTALAGIDDLVDDRSCLGSGNPEQSPTSGATWTDFDLDGRLDLVQANFLCFDTYTYYPDRFWRNNGDGTFTEWSEDHGFEWDNLAGRGAVSIDADLDGDLDVNIVDYVLQANLYYQNQGDGTFVEAAQDLGLAGKRTRFSGYGYYGHSIGLAWGDLDQDGDFDAVHANLAHPRFYQFSDRTNVLFQDAGTWTNLADERGIVYQETHSNPSLLDFDNDGDLDLTITEVYDGRPTDVYENDGAGSFTQRRHEAGITTESGWGSAVADYDNDGDQDLVAYSLFENRRTDTGHWLELRLVGDVRSNRAAIGAVAWIETPSGTLLRWVNGGTGTGCQDSLTLHVGLGAETTITEVRVWFPGGDTVTWTGLQADRAYRLYESGAISEGLGRPS